MREQSSLLGATRSSGRVILGGRSEPLFIGYSVKNRKFNRPFFQFAGNLARAEFSKLLVAIFDHPYAYNDSAARAAFPSDQDFARCAAIGNERATMAHRALDPIRDLAYEIRRWDVLDTDAAKLLRTELQSAVDADSDLRSELIKHVKVWLPSSQGGDPSRFLGFQVSEIPVLIDLHYRQGFLTDIYPGSLNDFFFQLESGRWASSMPIATSYADGKRLAALTYIPATREAANCLAASEQAAISPRHSLGDSTFA